MTRKRKSNLPSAVQKQLDQIVPPPRVQIVLDDRQIDIITRYRAAKEAMRESISRAINNQGDDRLWTPEDREAVDRADELLSICQIEMCALLDVALLAAGR